MLCDYLGPFKEHAHDVGYWSEESGGDGGEDGNHFVGADGRPIGAGVGGGSGGAGHFGELPVTAKQSVITHWVRCVLPIVCNHPIDFSGCFVFLPGNFIIIIIQSIKACARLQSAKSKCISEEALESLIVGKVKLLRIFLYLYFCYSNSYIGN